MLECKGLNEYLNEYNRFSAQGAYLLFFTSWEGSDLKQALYTKDRVLTYFLRNSRMCEK